LGLVETTPYFSTENTNLFFLRGKKICLHSYQAGQNSVVPTGKWWYFVGEHSFHNKENLMYGIQTGSGVNNIDETEEEFPHDD